MAKSSKAGVWWLPGKPGAPPVIGGHRGLGQNLLGANAPASRPVPEFRENTLASLRGAAERGAAFVEFDVQVTADGVPVLWHDDDIITRASDGIGSVSRKVVEVTLEEFRACPALGILGRVRPAYDYKSEGVLVPWEVEKDDGLPTLDEVFQGMPPDVGFDIEVKMAIPDTVAQTPPEEVERMLGPILEVIGRHTKSAADGESSQPRALALTSFDPDICLALKKRVPTSPILFLTVGMAYPHADPRRTSLEAALTFAEENKLEGIVPMGMSLEEQTEMVERAAAKGLAIATWSAWPRDKNNDPAHIKVQQQWGVGAVIVDDVATIVAAQSA